MAPKKNQKPISWQAKQIELLSAMKSKRTADFELEKQKAFRDNGSVPNVHEDVLTAAITANSVYESSKNDVLSRVQKGQDSSIAKELELMSTIKTKRKQRRSARKSALAEQKQRKREEIGARDEEMRASEQKRVAAGKKAIAIREEEKLAQAEIDILGQEEKEETEDENRLIQMFYAAPTDEVQDMILGVVKEDEELTDLDEDDVGGEVDAIAGANRAPKKSVDDTPHHPKRL